MTTIHATGVSEQHFQAERATITAHISIASTDRAKSVAAATRLHNQVTQRAVQLRESGDATWHAANPISTWVRKVHAEAAGAEAAIEHVTTSQVQVKLSNLTIVSAVVAELTEAGTETSVQWSLTEAFRRACERDCRKQAVKSAQVIAADYAEALGQQITRVVSISDWQDQGNWQPMRTADFIVGGQAEATLAEITVSATVGGVFESA